MKRKEQNEKDRLLPYRWLYLVVSAVCMLINAGLASYYLFSEGAGEQYRVILIVLLIASAVLIPASVVLVFLDKCPSSFFISLIASAIIIYAGFFLWIRSQEIPFDTILFYQGSSLILPVFTAVFWGFYRKEKRRKLGIVFAKTEKDREKKTPSILD